jgi:hypothetical protein
VCLRERERARARARERVEILRMLQRFFVQQ